MNSATEKVFFQTSHLVEMQKALRVNKEMSMMNSSPPPGASIWQVAVVEDGISCPRNLAVPIELQPILVNLLHLPNLSLGLSHRSCC